MKNLLSEESKLERMTRRWWFFVLFILIQFITPPYASKGYKFPEEWSDVLFHVLSHGIIFSLSKWYPAINVIFKTIPMVLIFLIIIFQNKVRRLLNIYVGITYILFAFGQSISVTEKYGVAVCTLNLIMFLVVAAFWAWEAVVVKNNFTLAKQSIWKYWVVPLALLAFWYPLSPRTGKPDFNFIYLFTNGAGLAFCTMTPLYLALLTLYYPKVNMAVFRVTSLVGLIIGLYNMATNFLIKPTTHWWNGILHIPLLSISMYGLILSLRQEKQGGVKTLPYKTGFLLSQE